jgi:hypothetical protein
MLETTSININTYISQKPYAVTSILNDIENNHNEWISRRNACIRRYLIFSGPIVFYNVLMGFLLWPTYNYSFLFFQTSFFCPLYSHIIGLIVYCIWSRYVFGCFKDDDSHLSFPLEKILLFWNIISIVSCIHNIVVFERSHNHGNTYVPALFIGSIVNIIAYLLLSINFTCYLCSK